MKRQPIEVYNRYTGRLEREQVAGEACMRLIYGNPLGELALHALVKRAFFSRLMGRMQDRPASRKAIEPFIRKYGIDMADFLVPEGGFRSFNEFFCRRLAPGARPVCAGATVVFPADARHSGWQDASKVDGVFVKGQRFDWRALLGEELAERYGNGSVVLSRLCPTDYHRFHFVAAGVPSSPVRIGGPLASVSPYCLRRRLAWLWTNKREWNLLETPDLGTVLTLAVGATGVGAIYQTYAPGEEVAKGAEQGYFAFGGSTVMTFFEPGRVRLADDLVQNTSRQIETFARQGDCMGELIG